MRNNKSTGIIYGYYCKVTDMWYIGQTSNPEGRFNQHKYEAITKKDNTIFHKAIRRYGLDNFVYCVLEENVLVDNLDMREMDWIEYYDSFYNGYNMTAGGYGQVYRICGKETRKKMSESRKRRIPPNMKRVNKYDLNGNYIQTYNSIKEAIEQNPKCSYISWVCKGKLKTSGGFIWKYA